MQHTLSIIRAIESERKAANIAPTHATEAMVRERNIAAAEKLDEMERCGMIRMGRTVNSRWIKIVGSL